MPPPAGGPGRRSAGWTPPQRDPVGGVGGGERGGMEEEDGLR